MSYQKFKLYKKFAERSVIIGLMLLLGRGCAIAQTRMPNEAQVKSVFILYFAQFTTWPDSEFADPLSPFIIGLLGNYEAEEFLRDVMKGERIAGHPIEVRRYNSIDHVESCHVLIINVKTQSLDQELRKLEGKNILTVGDLPDFTKKGGMVRLYNDNNKIRFEINVTAVKAANLVLSSKLLRLADICCEQDD